MTDAVVAGNGQTYQRSAIKTHMQDSYKGERTDPSHTLHTFVRKSRTDVKLNALVVCCAATGQCLSPTSRQPMSSILLPNRNIQTQARQAKRQQPH